jgi:hypothetical protein
MLAEKQDDAPVGEWFHEHELPGYVRIPLDIIVRARRRGEWAPHVRVGAQVIYSKATLDAWLAARETAAAVND